MKRSPARIVTPAKQRGKIAPVAMSHVVFNTHPDNYAAMVHWYTTVFEAEMAYENEFVAFLGYDEEHHRFAIVKMDHVIKPEKDGWGVNHIAFTYENLEQLLDTYMRLKDAGIEPYWPILHGPTTSLYYKDPDLNRIELLVDNMPPDELLEFFASGAYDENFMGIIFDPEEMYRQLQAGVSAKELTSRAKLPEGKTPWDMFRD